MAVILLVPLFAGLGGADSAAVPVWRLDDAPRAGHVDAIGGNDDVLVVVLGDGQALRSTDGAATWEPINGLPALAKSWIEFDPSEPARGYIASVGGVFRTTDHGASWTRVLDIARAPRIDVSPSGAVVVGARLADGANTVMVSTDHGATWADLAAPIPAGDPICGIAFGLMDDQVMTMTDTRSWYSHDAGATWVETPGNGLNFAVEDRKTVWRIDMGHVEKSTDGGATWVEVFPPGVGTLGAAHPQGGFYFASNVGLLLTRDGGETWDNLGHGDQVFDATGVLADPADPDAVFVTDKRVGLARIQRDTDGVSWYDGRPLAALPAAPVADVAAVANGRTVAVGDAGLFVRDAAWRHAGAGLDTVSGLTAVAASTDGSHVYAAGFDVTGNPAAVVSHDAGRTFFAAALQDVDGAVTTIVADPADPAHALLVLRTSGATTYLLETFDGGTTWGAAAPVPLPVAVTGLAWHGASGMPVAGTEAGVFARVGDAWVPVGTEPVVALGGGDGRVAAVGLTQHWDDLGLAVPAMAPVERDAARDARAVERGAGATWLLGDVLAKCRDGEMSCSTLTLPEGAAAVAPHEDGRVYLGTGDGLYRVVFL